MDIILWLVLGLVAGGLAKFILPGKDPGGLIVTMLIGVAGAVIGGFIGGLVGLGGIRGLDLSTLLTAVAGSIVLLVAFRVIKRR